MVSGDFRPQLATLVTEAPAGDQWLHEIKFDGYRIGCRIHNGRITLISRNGNDWTHAYQEIAAAAATLKTADALLDGEVTIVLPDGRTSFQALQHAAARQASQGALVYFVFDLLRLDGENLQELPLEARKARLRTLLGRRRGGCIRYADHVVGQGAVFLHEARRLGLEGIVSKRRDQPHRGGCNRDWLKTKITHRQEFVIGGFTDPEGTRAGLGALLIGYYDRTRLVFSGRVGTGFTQQSAVDLRRQLEGIVQASCPFDPPPAGPLGRRAHWVAPSLVCEVAFTEWTVDGMIRHPSFQGLRPDKRPRQVVRELARR